MVAGQDPALFWALTPREIDNIINAAGERARLDHNNTAWLAWHIAALGRTEKLPNLQTLLVTAGNRPRRARDWRDVLASLKAHTELINRR